MARRNTGSIRQVRPGVHKITVDVTKTNLPMARAEAEGYHYRVAEASPKHGCAGPRPSLRAPRDDAERKLHAMQVRGRQRQADGGLDPRPVAGFLAQHVRGPSCGAAPSRTTRLQVKNHIRPALGAVRLGDLQPLDIQRFQNRLAAGGLGAASVHKVRQVLNGALRQAVNNGLLDKSPVQGVKTPRAGAEEGPPRPRWSGCSSSSPTPAATSIFPCCGSWPSPACGSGRRWGWSGGTWTWWGANGVRQADRRHQQRRNVPGPAQVEAHGTRAIPLDDGTVAVLTAHRAQQDAARETAGRGLPGSGAGLPQRARRAAAHDPHPQDGAPGSLRNSTPTSSGHFFATQLMEAGELRSPGCPCCWGIPPSR